MFSGKAVKTFEGCRFCPMCRHACPIGLKTGNENNTPRAKALFLNYVTRGMAYSDEMAADMYECCLCYACATDCESGYEPPLFIREARTLAAVEDKIPPHVQRVLDKVNVTGNIFGVPAADKFAALRDSLAGVPDSGDVLVYLGATAAIKTPEIAAAFLSILHKAGVSFAVLPDEPQSGSELGDLIGFVDDVRLVAEKCASRIKASGAKQIVALDPGSARIFLHQYPAWGLELGGTVLTATAYVAGLIREKKIPLRDTGLEATYQDDSVLTRELDETEAPREIMAALGVRVKEMFLNGKKVKSGGTVLLKEYAPRLVELTSEGRWEDALRAGVPVLLGATPDVHYVLEGTAPASMQLHNLFTLLDANC